MHTLESISFSYRGLNRRFGRGLKFEVGLRYRDCKNGFWSTRRKLKCSAQCENFKPIYQSINDDWTRLNLLFAPDLTEAGGVIDYGDNGTQNGDADVGS